MAWKTSFVLSTLTTSILFSHQTFAMQALDEQDLRAVNAQDGIYLDVAVDEIQIDKLYWQDNAGSADTTNVVNGEKILSTVAQNVKISGDNVSTNFKLNTGRDSAGKVGLDLKMEGYYPLIEIAGVQICDNPQTRCSPDIGSIGLQSSNTTTPLTLNFSTKDGLFNRDSDANLEFGLKNTHLYLGQVKSGVSNQLNQLVLKNLNFNFKGLVRLYVDNAEGLKLTTGPTDHGYIDLMRVDDGGTYTAAELGATTYKNAAGTKPTSAGLNVEMMLKKDVASAAPYLLDSYSAPQNAKGLIRIGASGRIVNGYVQVRGTNAQGLNSPTAYAVDGTNILGNANQGSTTSNNSVAGSTGIGFRMRGEFTRTNDPMLSSNSATGRGTGQATMLEIGGAGQDSYGFEFGNLTVLRSDLTNQRAYFDSGNVYLNLTDTKTLLMPHNYVFQNSRFGGTAGTLTTAADYSQNIHNDTGINPYAFVMAVRGADFQSISRQGRFTNAARVPTAAKINDSVNQWGLALPFHNLNVNLAAYGLNNVAANTSYYYTTDATGNTMSRVAVGGAGTNIQRLGFSLGMSATGVDRNPDNSILGNKTTSIMVIDGAINPLTGTPSDYYFGLRNVDMLLKGTGTMGVENGSVNISLPNMLIVMAGELAAGYLPGAKYRTCPTNAVTCASPVNNFALSNDVLMGLKLRLGGNMAFSLIPNNARTDGSRLSIVGELTFDPTSKNTIQISDPIDGSILGLDNITGKVNFNNAIAIDRHTTGDGKVSFNMGLKINPDGTQAGALRVKDVNLYPAAAGVGQRLGEIAFTGGTLDSRFSIVPRN